MAIRTRTRCAHAGLPHDVVLDDLGVREQGTDHHRMRIGEQLFHRLARGFARERSAFSEGQRSTCPVVGDARQRRRGRAARRQWAAQESAQRQERSTGCLFAQSLRERRLLFFRQEIDHHDEKLARQRLGLLGRDANVVERCRDLGQRSRFELVTQVPDTKAPVEPATRALPPARKKESLGLRHSVRSLPDDGHFGGGRHIPIVVTAVLLSYLHSSTSRLLPG